MVWNEFDQVELG